MDTNMYLSPASNHPVPSLYTSSMMSSPRNFSSAYNLPESTRIDNTNGIMSYDPTPRKRPLEYGTDDYSQTNGKRFQLEPPYRFNAIQSQVRNTGYVNILINSAGRKVFSCFIGNCRFRSSTSEMFEKHLCYAHADQQNILRGFCELYENFDCPTPSYPQIFGRDEVVNPHFSRQPSEMYIKTEPEGDIMDETAFNYENNRLETLQPKSSLRFSHFGPLSFDATQIVPMEPANPPLAINTTEGFEFSIVKAESIAVDEDLNGTIKIDKENMESEESSLVESPKIDDYLLAYKPAEESQLLELLPATQDFKLPKSLKKVDANKELQIHREGSRPILRTCEPVNENQSLEVTRKDLRAECDEKSNESDLTSGISEEASDNEAIVEGMFEKCTENEKMLENTDSSSTKDEIKNNISLSSSEFDGILKKIKNSEKPKGDHKRILIEVEGLWKGADDIKKKEQGAVTASRQTKNSALNGQDSSAKEKKSATKGQNSASTSRNSVAASQNSVRWLTRGNDKQRQLIDDFLSKIDEKSITISRVLRTSRKNQGESPKPDSPKVRHQDNINQGLKIQFEQEKTPEMKKSTKIDSELDVQVRIEQNHPKYQLTKIYSDNSLNASTNTFDTSKHSDYIVDIKALMKKSGSSLEFISVKDLYPWIDENVSAAIFKSKTTIDILLTKFSLFSTFKCMNEMCYYFTTDFNDFQKHVKCHESINNYCCYCLKNFDNSAELCDHLDAEHKFDRFQCNKCMYRSCQKGYVDIHQAHHHPNIENLVVLKSPVQKLLKSDRSKCLPALQKNRDKFVQPYRCKTPRCREVFFSKENFKNHLESELTKPNSQGFTPLIQQQLNTIDHTKTSTNSEGVFQCLHCQYGTDELDMQKHMALNHPHQFTYVCKRVKPQRLIELNIVSARETVENSTSIEYIVITATEAKCYEGNLENLISTNLENSASLAKNLVDVPKMSANACEIEKLIKNSKHSRIEFVSLKDLYPWIDESVTKAIFKNKPAVAILLNEFSQFSTYKCMNEMCFYFSADFEEFKKHTRSHDAINNYCSYCLKNFDNTADLCNHIDITHKFDRFQCNKCMYRSCQKGYVDIHQAHHHANEANLEVFKSPVQKLLKSDRSKCLPDLQKNREKFVQPYRCKTPRCREVFFSKENFKNHLESELTRPHSQGFAPLIQQQLNTIDHTKTSTNSEGVFQCLYCQYGTDNQEMQKHMALNHPHEFAYVCKRVKPQRLIELNIVPARETVENSTCIEYIGTSTTEAKNFEGSLDTLSSTSLEQKAQKMCLVVSEVASLDA